MNTKDEFRKKTAFLLKIFCQRDFKKFKIEDSKAEFRFPQKRKVSSIKEKMKKAKLDKTLKFL